MKCKLLSWSRIKSANIVWIPSNIQPFKALKKIGQWFQREFAITNLENMLKCWLVFYIWKIFCLVCPFIHHHQKFSKIKLASNQQQQQTNRHKPLKRPKTNDNLIKVTIMINSSRSALFLWWLWLWWFKRINTGAYSFLINFSFCYFFWLVFGFGFLVNATVYKSNIF